MKNRTLWMLVICAVLVLGLIAFVGINQSKATTEQTIQSEEQSSMDKEPVDEAKPDIAPLETAETAPATDEERAVTSDETEDQTQEETTNPEETLAPEVSPDPEETPEAGEEIEIIDGEDGTEVITVPEDMDVGEL